MNRYMLKKIITQADAACAVLKELRDNARLYGLGCAGIERAMCEVVAFDQELAPQALESMRQGGD